MVEGRGEREIYRMRKRRLARARTLFDAAAAKLKGGLYYISLLDTYLLCRYLPR